MPPAYDVIIAGGSFAGIACARALVREGCSVLVLERRADVGEGIRTTGILVQEAADMLPLPEALVRPIRSVCLYAPSLRHVRIDSERYVFYATDTPALMRHLARKAEGEGVRFCFDTGFARATPAGERLVVNGGLAEGRFLVGADGARSGVARHFGLGLNRRFLLGVEAEYRGIGIGANDAFHCLLDRRFAPGYLGWVIPGPKVTQIGLAANAHGAKPDIDGFYRHISPLLTQERPEVVERRGGLIPVGGLVRPFYGERVILLGDAAGIVSPLTAGGIHTALYYGNRLGQLLAAYLRGQGAHPGTALEREYPRFRSKLLLRALYEYLPNAGLEALVASPVSQPLARGVFFLKKRLPRARRPALR